MNRAELEYYIERYGDMPIKALPKIIYYEEKLLASANYDEQCYWYAELSRYINKEYK